MTLDELKAEFPNVADNVVLSYPWWTKHTDINEKIIKRLEKFWDEILASDEEEVLAVCHGASFYGTICYFNKKLGLGLTNDIEEMSSYLAERNLNCSLKLHVILNEVKNLNKVQRFFGRRSSLRMTGGLQEGAFLFK